MCQTGVQRAGLSSVERLEEKLLWSIVASASVLTFFFFSILFLTCSSSIRHSVVMTQMRTSRRGAYSTLEAFKCAALISCTRPKTAL